MSEIERVAAMRPEGFNYLPEAWRAYIAGLESVRSEALELLDGWQKVLEVDTPSAGLCEGKFTLWHVHGTHRHVLAIARNSYDDAALNTILGLLEATRAILQYSEDVHSTELRK